MQLAALVFLILLTLIGYRIILAVPPLLHTPLMSGMNALSGVTVLGAVAVATSSSEGITLAGALAIILGMVNVVGGFWVTDRMLRMFRADTRKASG